MTARELVLACLRGESVPRPPVLCSGGMMCFAVTEVMRQTGCWWPKAHRNADSMASLAIAMHRATGFDNAGLPFCMTVEAEVLGAEVDLGNAEVQPRIAREPLGELDGAEAILDSLNAKADRRQVVIQAMRMVRAALPDVALIGNVVGPISLAGQLVEASRLLRGLHRQPDQARALIARAAVVARDFALQQIAAGADAIMIAEPTGTGEILGAARYRAFAEPALAPLIAAIQSTGTPVILHICGNTRTILGALADCPAEAISVDETTDLRLARAALPRHRLMGNVCAELLRNGPSARVQRLAQRGLEMGVDILAPACGVVPTTPVAHLQALPVVAHRCPTRSPAPTGGSGG